MGSESLDFLTEQELKWISQSEQAPNNENVNTNKRFKSSAKRSRPVAEITLAATSLCKRGLDITDKFYVMSMDTNIRLGSVRLKHEVIRIGKEDSFFLTTLAELDICEFEFKLIYVPPKLFIGQELYLECTIRIIQQAFRDNNEDGILGENSISSKKAALDLLFKRAGLLKPKDAKPINEQCADLVGNFGTMFCTRKKFRYLEVAAGMDCNLRDYQKEALAFMFDRETAANDNEISPLYHKIPYLDGDYFYYSSFLGEIRMNLPMGNVCQGLKLLTRWDFG